MGDCCESKRCALTAMRETQAHVLWVLLVINALIMPSSGMMGVVGAAALAANLVCFAMLYGHRGDNLNMSSTWRWPRRFAVYLRSGW